MTRLEEIAAEAAKLSEKEGAVLASRLIDGLKPSNYEVADAEVAERMSEAEEDPCVWISLDELIAGLPRLS